MTCCHMLTARKSLLCRSAFVSSIMSRLHSFRQSKEDQLKKTERKMGTFRPEEHEVATFPNLLLSPPFVIFHSAHLHIQMNLVLLFFFRNVVTDSTSFSPKNCPEIRNRCVFGSAAVNAICGRRQELRAWNTPEFPLKIIFKNSISLNNDHLQSKKW
jgi:hypothetical protein